jgi:uncharacterized protein YyaL (SSP411 family)
MSQEKKPNRLIHSTSPYLLQHAYNPVDWFEWGAEALGKASAEDKPILVSIGYSACHWCHVMEHESFENEEVAKVMNDKFVCIKVDREERPDIDQIYMEAVQAMQQHGGWPLNVFLTPQQKPFYGGTYFPRASWSNLLGQIDKAFKEKRNEIDASAESLREHLQAGDVQRFARDGGDAKFRIETLDKMAQTLAARFDKEWGGMDKAPKFVMPTIWLFLLRHFSITKNKESLEMVILTLRKMIMGGLYDQIGGGFARYSVDSRWFAPHFEKMLYDNGQLLSLYAEAFAVTKLPEFRATIYETVGWLKREMSNVDGGFYSALDADSEGVEGMFYTWTWEELDNLLSRDSKTKEFFGATMDGNWDHGRNILIRSGTERNDSVEQDKQLMLQTRSRRVRPGLDDKILSGWNCMTVKGLADSYRVFSDPSLLELARKNIGFVEGNLIDNGMLHRAYKGKRSDTEGFLEDYAFFVQALISLYEVTFEEEWLRKAERWTNYTIENFFDATDGYFHFSSRLAEKLIARRKEIFDNVIPSSNSVMARNLFKLGTLVGNSEWTALAKKMTTSLGHIIESEPGYMSNWGILLAEITKGLTEVVISGKDAEKLRLEFHSSYNPFSVTLGTTSRSDLPLLKGREPVDETTRVFVCFNSTCNLPVNSIPEALKQIEQG